jgi:hypothetical protein
MCYLGNLASLSTRPLQGRFSRGRSRIARWDGSVSTTPSQTLPLPALCALCTDEMSQARRFARAPPAAAPAVLSGRTSLCSASSRRYRGRSPWSRRLPFSQLRLYPGQQRGGGVAQTSGGRGSRRVVAVSRLAVAAPLPSQAVRARHAGQGRALICCDAVVRWLARSRGADEWSRLACVHGRCGWG